MRNYLLCALFVVACGCSANIYLGAISDGITQGEPVVAALEDATGQTIPADVSAKGEQVSTGIATAAKAGAAIAAVVPGGQVAVPFLGALAGLATVLATFFRRRLQTSEKVNVAVMKGVDSLKGAGGAIVSSALSAGVADATEKMYQGKVKQGS